MGFIEQQEVSGFKQDIKHGEVKQFAEKNEFERKLLAGLGEEMERDLSDPNFVKKNQKIAKRYTRKKKHTTWKENIKRIFNGKKNTE